MLPVLLVRASHDGLASVSAGGSLRHQVDLGAVDWACDQRLKHGDRETRYELHYGGLVLNTCRRVLLAQVRQPNEERVLVNIASHEPSDVW